MEGRAMSTISSYWTFKNFYPNTHNAHNTPTNNVVTKIGETQLAILEYLAKKNVSEFTVKALWEDMTREGLISLSLDSFRKAINRFVNDSKKATIIVRVKRGRYKVVGDLKKFLNHARLVPKFKGRPRGKPPIIPYDSSVRFQVLYDHVNGIGKDGQPLDWIAKERGNKRLTLQELREKYQALNYFEVDLVDNRPPYAMREGFIVAYYSREERRLVHEFRFYEGVVKTRSVEALTRLAVDYFKRESFALLEALLALLKDRPLERTGYLSQLANLLKGLLSPEEKKWFGPRVASY